MAYIKERMDIISDLKKKWKKKKKIEIIEH